MARFAAIDIGSNALRLRVVEVERPGDLASAGRAGEARPGAARELASMRASVRLGREVFLTGALTPGAIASATEALRQFRQQMDALKVDQYRAVATSAVREAKNARVFVERAEREAGVHVDVIEGVEEARLVQLAVRRRMKLEGRRALLIDIGGGSTELTLLDGGDLRASQSLPMGTVRLLEAFLDGGAAFGARQTRLVDEFLERVCGEISAEIITGRPEVVVATGGNIDTLAALCPAQIEGEAAVDLASTRRLADRLAAMSAPERSVAYGLRPDRADTIVPAAAILLHITSRFDQRVVVAPAVGVKEGVLEELTERHFAVWSTGGEEDAVAKACVRLGRRYRFDEGHGLTVARFAVQIFDDLAARHGLGPRDRLLLQAAAILHDIGDFVRYEGHHKHSYYVIEHSDIMGITPAERGVVANVARYHRKSLPDPAHEGFRQLSREDRARVRVLAAVLRLADALDREHLGKVTNVRAGVVEGRLRLSVEGAADRELEEWTVAQKADLMKAEFGLDVEVVDAAVSMRRVTSAVARGPS